MKMTRGKEGALHLLFLSQIFLVNSTPKNLVTREREEEERQYRIELGLEQKQVFDTQCLN
jgi:hypothetical protein